MSAKGNRTGGGGRKIVAATLAAAVLGGGGAWAAEGWFSDVPDDHRRVEAIRYAKAEGFFQGYPDGRFGPDEELSQTQFQKVVERLYDRYDRWTRADWAQVLYGGFPSLTASPAPAPAPAPTTTAPATIPVATDPGTGAQCGWPLGAAERISAVARPPAQIRFPINPCAPPVTYRIEFNGGQMFNIPFRTTARAFSPPLAWPASLGVGTVRVTEFRPGGPANGKVLGETKVPWESVLERPPAPTTTTTTTTAPTTTTTKVPTTTIPPRPVPDVPYDERDVVVYWFVYPGSDEKGDTPLFAVYVSDPDGPIPAEPDPAAIGISVTLDTASGEGGWLDQPHTLHMYRGENPYGGRSFGARDFRAAFPILIGNAPEDFTGGQVGVRYEAPDRFNVRAPMHPFRNVTFTQVQPPSAECIYAWRQPQLGNVHFNPSCRPYEWSEWWGVRALIQ